MGIDGFFGAMLPAGGVGAGQPAPPSALLQPASTPANTENNSVMLILFILNTHISQSYLY